VHQIGHYLRLLKEMLLNIIGFLNSFGKSGSNYVKVFAPTDIMYCSTGFLKLDENYFSFDL
jgi:hypothetical protein